MKDEFWDGAKAGGSIPIPGVAAIAVFLGSDDDVVIQQDGQNDDDAVIFVNVKYVSALIKALKEVKKQACNAPVTHE